MIIRKLEIAGFGKFQNFSLEFSPSCNVIYGENEAGKSTIHAFIQAMLYGIPSSPSRKEEFFRHRPFSKNLPFGGSLIFSFQGKDYRLSRNFLSGGNAEIFPEEIKLSEGNSSYEKSSRKPIEESTLFLEKVLSSFSLESFKNTVSIRQLKSGTNREMIKELQNIFSNMNYSRNMNINPDAAISFLEDEEKKLKEEIYFQAEKEYSSLLGEAKNIQQESVQSDILSGCSDDNSSLSLSEAIQSHENNLKQITEKLESKIIKLTDLQKEIQNVEALLKRESFVSSEEAMEEEETLKNLLNENKEEKGEKKYKPFFPLLLLLLALFFISYTIFSWLYSYTSLPLPSVFSLRINGISMLYPSACASLFFFIFAWTIASEEKKRAEQRKQREITYKNILEKRHISDFAPYMNSGKEEIGEDGDPEFFRPYVIESYYSEIKKSFGLISQKKGELEKVNREILSLKEEEKKEEELRNALISRENSLEESLRQISNLQNRAEQIRPFLQENERYKEKMEAIEEAKERIENLSKDIYQSFAFHLNKETAIALSKITNEHYDALFIDQNLRIFVDTREKLIPLEQISTGTIDQLYLSLRLATAKIMQKGKEEYLPLLFDDSFAMYDEKRLSAALHFIRQDYPSQILLFSCHKRESTILKQLNIPFYFICL